MMRFNKLIPELGVTDLKKSLDFYTTLIGFKIEYRREESKFAFLSFQDSQIILEELNDTWKTGKLEYPFGRGINLQIEVVDIEPILASLKNTKYPLFVEPEENWYRRGDMLIGCREFLIKDPDGYLLRFSQNLGTKPVGED